MYAYCRKPDGVHHCHTRKLIHQFEEKDFPLVATKMFTAKEEFLKLHYDEYDYGKKLTPTK